MGKAMIIGIAFALFGLGTAIWAWMYALAGASDVPIATSNPFLAVFGPLIPVFTFGGILLIWLDRVITKKAGG